MSSFSLDNYRLIIFDFDGVIADSLGSYRELDRLLIKDLYNVDEQIAQIEQMSQMVKTGAINNSEDDYYRFIDKKYGDGQKPIDEIWKKIFELAPVVQRNIQLKPFVLEAMQKIKAVFPWPITLATSSSRSDIDFFSTKESVIGKQINLNQYFNTVITFDDVKKPKPDPESFQKVIDKYGTNPGQVLIFEDSLSGVLAGKAAGATVIAIEDIHNEKNKSGIQGSADLYFENWQQFIDILK